MRLTFSLTIALIVAIGNAWTPTFLSALQPAAQSVILITLDGARTEEIFGGLDRDVFTSTLREKQTLQEQPAYQRFCSETPSERR